MGHMLGQLATMRFSGPLLAALVLLSQRAALVLCALWPLRSTEESPFHWCRFGGWGTLEAKCSLAFVF